MNAHTPVEDPNIAAVQKSGPTLTSSAAKAHNEDNGTDTSNSSKDNVSTQDYYKKEELAEVIRKSFRTNENFNERYEALWAMLAKSLPAFDITKTTSQTSKKPIYDMPALFYSALHSIEPVSSSPQTGTLFASKNGHIQVKNGEIQFVPDKDPKKSKGEKTVPKQLTYHDAFSAILIASTNKDMLPPNRLLIEGGTRAERLMYMRAVAAYNATVPKELQFKTNRAALDLSPVDNAAKEFSRFMSRARTYAIHHNGEQPSQQPELPSHADLRDFTVPDPSATTSGAADPAGSPRNNVEASSAPQEVASSQTGVSEESPDGTDHIDPFSPEANNNIKSDTPDLAEDGKQEDVGSEATGVVASKTDAPGDEAVAHAGPATSGEQPSEADNNATPAAEEPKSAPTGLRARILSAFRRHGASSGKRDEAETPITATGEAIRSRPEFQNVAQSERPDTPVFTRLGHNTAASAPRAGAGSMG